MDNISSAPVWDPASSRSRFAETPGNIHRFMAFVYGGFGTLFALVDLASHTHDVEEEILVIGVLAALTALHAALAFGAGRRSDAAKVGSIAVGVLMLFAIPIGTVVGILLIRNASQSWPPRRDTSAAPAGPDLRAL